MLLVVTVIDLYHQIIPNRVLLVSGVLGLPLIYLQSLEILKTGTIGFFVAGALLFIIALVSKGGMGGGDIKLAAVMGMFLGLKLVMVALFLAFLIGGIIGIILLATGQRGRKDPIPFGPFLALGSLIAALVGEKIISWYTGFW
nr:A24 family peptidase [Desulforamulus aquiferis]